MIYYAQIAVAFHGHAVIVSIKSCYQAFYVNWNAFTYSYSLFCLYKSAFLTSCEAGTDKANEICHDTIKTNAILTIFLYFIRLKILKSKVIIFTNDRLNAKK